MKKEDTTELKMLFQIIELSNLKNISRIFVINWARVQMLNQIIMINLLKYLKIVHAERASRYGGNIRVHIAKDLDEKTSFNIEKLLSIEKKFGLYNDFF